MAAPLGDLISKRAFATLCGVGVQAVYRASTRALEPALVKRGRRELIDVGHAAARRYQAGGGNAGRSSTSQRTRAPGMSRAGLPAPAVPNAGAALPAAEGFSPEAIAATLAARGTTDGPGPVRVALPVGTSGPGESADPGVEHRLEYVADVEQQLESTGASNVFDLAGMKLGDCVERWGSLPGMADAVRALKLEADMQLARHKRDVSRGQFIEREFVEGVLLPLIETAWVRIVAEAPGALAASVVGLVTSGHVEALDYAVEELIRAQLSSILTSVRGEYVKQLAAKS